MSEKRVREQERKPSRKKKLRRKTRAYRQIVINYNIMATIFIFVAVIFCAFHVFTHKRSYRDTGIELYNQGNYESAITYFNKSLAEKQWFSNNVDADVLMYKASAYLNIEQYENAKKCYEDLEKNYSEEYYNKEEIDFIIRLCDGLIFYRDKNYIAALQPLKEACDRGYYELALYTAICYENMGEAQNIDKNVYMKLYLDTYTSHNPVDAFVYYKYAVYYININDYTNAIENLKAAYALNDENFQQTVLYSLIMCYVKNNDFNNAYAYCNQYTASYPADDRGKELMDYLESRGNPDTEVINDIFEVNGNKNDSE